MSHAWVEPDEPFGRMLAWSAVLHLALLLALAVAARLGRPAPELPPPSIAWVVPGVGGPGPGGGAPTPAPPSPPKPAPPEPEERPEPEPETRVVRPTRERREQLPMPDAPERRRPRREEPPPSGLTGRDAAQAPSARLAQPGLPGLGLGGAGGGSPFDEDFEYAYYVQQMLGRIYEHWQRLPVKGTAVVVVRFTIMKNGEVRDVEIETSSGVPILDRAAARAVLLASPLPPLPDSYPRDRVGVHLRFEYSGD